MRFRKTRQRLAIGQRVGVAWLRHTCGCCSFCTTGKENLCESARFTGYHADGGYAEYAVAPAAFCYELPEEFQGHQSLAAVVFRHHRLSGPAAVQSPARRPTGALRIRLVGHVVIQIALASRLRSLRGPRGENHRELARQMGAAWVGEDAAQMPVKVDSAIMFAPAGELVLPSLESLKKGGTLSLAGIYMTPIPQMDYERYVFYQRDIHLVTCNTRQDGRELLAEAAAIPIRPHTTLYPLVEANRALQDSKNDRISGTGVLTIGDE